MKTRKKQSRAIGIAIIIAGVLIIAALIYFLSINQGPQYFVYYKKNQATKLYDEIMAYDYSNLNTPESILDVNNKISLLLYGDMLTNDELLPGILQKQRLLYDDALLEINSFEDQLSALTKGLKEYKANKTVCYDVSVTRPPTLSQDYDNIYIATIEWQTNNMGKINWEYALIKKEDGQFRIRRFEAVK